MKLTTKLCGAALLAVIGVATVAPKASVIKADSTTRDGLGEIEFVTATYGSFDTSGSGVVPPNSTDTTQNTGETLYDGEFVVQGMSKLDFGQHEAVVGAVEAWAKPTTANAGASDEVAGRGNWVQWKDNRTTDDHKYYLGAKITDKFSTTVNGTKRTLSGSTITYNNPFLVAAKDNESLKPSVLPNASTSVNENSVSTVFSNTEETKGRGVYAIYFGEKGNAAAPADKSVQLNIPSNQAQEIQKAKYTATITWTLSTVPL